MSATFTQHPTTDTAPRVKLTMAFPADLHAATTDLAVRNRRSFTAEVCTAMDEHLAAANKSPTLENDED